MTKRECAIVMAYTGTCMLAGENLGVFYEYVHELMGEPIQTFEYPSRADEIREMAKPDFLRLCREATA